MVSALFSLPFQGHYHNPESDRVGDKLHSSINMEAEPCTSTTECTTENPSSSSSIIDIDIDSIAL
jgi:hypothetical protein